jgi:hypothetical protein
MATRQQALAAYNAQHNTTYTLTTLAVALLNDALRAAWISYREDIVVSQVRQEIVDAT